MGGFRRNPRYPGHRMTLDKKIRETIAARFPKVPGALLDECVRVSDKLSQGVGSKNVKEGLKALERGLARAVDQKARSAMGSTLAQQERAAGLNVDAAGNTVVSVNRPLGNDEAHGLLAAGRIWKDPGIDPDHGEHTHRMQWYIVTSQKLVKEPRAFLAALAEHRGDRPLSSLWDCLFDRVTETPLEGSQVFCANGPDDFRCPEHLHLHLVRDRSGTYPTLQKLLHIRREKRTDFRVPMQSAGERERLRRSLAQYGLDEELHRAIGIITRQQGAKGADAQRMFYTALRYELKKEGIGYDADGGQLEVKTADPPQAIRKALANIERGFREKVFE